MKSEPKESLLLAAVSYVDRLRWAVLPGARCSGQDVCVCAGTACSERQPVRAGEGDGPSPSRDVRRVLEWWTAMPDANILTPVGYHFDAVMVPEAAGKEALSRTGDGRIQGWAGLVSHGRIVFLLRSGLGYQLKIRLGRRLDEHGIRIYGQDELIALPPSPGVTWINDNGPFASLSVDPSGLIPALTSACARQAGQTQSLAQRTSTHPTVVRTRRATHSTGPAMVTLHPSPVPSSNEVSGNPTAGIGQ
jgi:hypothetical protein